MTRAIGGPGDGIGRGLNRGGAAEGSPKVMVLGEELASVPLTPSITEGSVPVGTSRREGSAVIEASREPSLDLTSMGSDLPTWSKPLLW